MNRLLIMLMAAMLLVACGNKDDVHKNINESLANDSMTILEIATNAVEEGRSLTEKEEGTIERYEEKHKLNDDDDGIERSNEDIALFVATTELISSAKVAGTQSGLPSDKELFELRVERFENVLKTGELISKKEMKELTE